MNPTSLISLRPTAVVERPAGRRAGGWCRAATPRSGFSLIEMMAAMAVVSVVLTLVTLVIFQLQRLTLTESAKTADSLAFVDFARTFRSDVHRASAAEAVEQGLRLTSASGENITYRETNRVLVREATGQAARRTVVDDYTVQWLVSDALVRLTLQPKNSGVGRPWQFDAALGLTAATSSENGETTSEGDGP